MSDEQTGPGKGTSSLILAGLGMGTLIGLLVGLSVSPVVAGVLTTLGGLLTAMLGVQPGGGNANRRFQVNAAPIAAFGFACALAALGGLYIRNHELMAPSLQQQVERWTTGKLFTKEEAKKLVVFQRLGLAPKGTTVVDTTVQKTGAVGLFSSGPGSSEAVDPCALLETQDFTENPRELLSSWDDLAPTGEQELLQSRLEQKRGGLAAALTAAKGLNDQQLLAIIESMNEILCVTSN